MEQVEVKSLATKVGRIGFGCDPLGEHGWGALDRSAMAAAIHVAVDSGINLFDISDVYGLGRAETTLGEALVGKRSRAVIVSKFGIRVEEGRGTFYDTSVAWIRNALEASLRRLRTDFIDVYLMHYWDERTPLDLVFSTLEEARQAGKIRAYGFSNANPKAMFENIPAGLKPHMAAFTLQYSLLDRHFEGIIESVMQDDGLTFLSWGSLAEGLLTGKFAPGLDLHADDRRHQYRNFVGQRFEENRHILGRIAALSSVLERPCASIALRWILDRLPGSVALVGMKSSKNVIDAIGALGWSLSRSSIDELDALTLHRRRERADGMQFINPANATSPLP